MTRPPPISTLSPSPPFSGSRRGGGGGGKGGKEGNEEPEGGSLAGGRGADGGRWLGRHLRGHPRDLPSRGADLAHGPPRSPDRSAQSQAVQGADGARLE